MYKRLLSSEFNEKASCFVFGPRQTGKTTLLKAVPTLFNINLLKSKEFLKYNHDPDLLFKEVENLNKENGYVWIDEIQRIPTLLDIVHECIEALPEIHFILSGSSSRKLRQGAANLLGGRALDLRLHPLCSFELDETFDLELILQVGTLPKIYSLAKLKSEINLAHDYLSSYVTTYLQDEIKAEALVRNLSSFQSFLKVSAAQFGQEINFSSIADDCQVSDDTVRSYYSVLEDTLIGFFLLPYSRSTRKRLSHRPKFYFFDNGVTRAILGIHRSPLTAIDRGRLFEQFVIQELIRLNDYFNKELTFSFWRTSSGAEVDLLIERGQEVFAAVECKSSQTVSKRDLTGLLSFADDFPNTQLYLCAPVIRPLEESGITILPPRTLFDKLRQV